MQIHEGIIPVHEGIIPVAKEIVINQLSPIKLINWDNLLLLHS